MGVTGILKFRKNNKNVYLSKRQRFKTNASLIERLSAKRKNSYGFKNVEAIRCMRWEVGGLRSRGEVN